MNINQVRQVLGDAVPNEVKTLELRVGQVVRGVVLQQLPNQEAVVSINGVQVKAKLEVPILEGQASLLQVQPDSKGGNIHFKQVDPTTLGLQDPMKDILKAMQLPDKQWAHELVKDLRREGFALNKEATIAFQRAATLMPVGVNQEQWMQAAATLYKRGLPLTEATLTAMHQLQSGTPTHNLMDQLRSQLIGMQPNQSSALTQGLVKQLVSFLNNVSHLTSQMTSMTQPSTQPTATTAATQTIVNQPTTSIVNQTAQPFQGTATTSTNVTQNAGTQPSPASTITSESVVAGQTANNQATQTTGNSTINANQPNILSQLMKVLGVNHEVILSKQVIQQPPATPNQGQQTAMNGQQIAHQANANQQHAASTNTVQAGAQMVNTSTQGNQLTTNNVAMTNTVAAQQGENASPTQAVTTSQPQSGAIGNQANTQINQNQPAAQGSLNPLTTNTNQMINGESSNPAIANQSSPTSVGQGQGQVIGQSMSQQLTGNAQQVMSQSQSQVSLQAQDSIKSSIIQLLQQQDVPANVKETAQQLLQAITGQQLMLSAERNQSVFSHVTMYIPLRNDEDGQTAAVHIQTRRDRKGELDAENCRIVFDLNMNSLGPVLVDVNIVNKIISLNLWNDHPALETIMDSLKPEISDALYKNGFMLSSIRTTPIPAKDEQQSVEEGKAVIIPPDIDQLNSKRYKGVDFKV